MRSVATRIEVPTARPFVKWAGGKTQLLPELRRRIPSDFNRYIEPFVGGGALFFDLATPMGTRVGDPCAGIGGAKVILNDSNKWLAATYKAIRDIPASVINCLKMHEHDYTHEGADHYYKIRNGPRATESAWIAADFIFLNKAGFNGLFRVNKSGVFNVPAGKFKKQPTICDEENLRAVSLALQGVGIWSEGFECIQRECVPGDFVYFDPPYWPVSASSDFTAYTKEPFGPAEQERLRDLALDLKRRDVRVLLSNADVEPVRKLYAKGFTVERVEARRAINSDASKRGSVGELLIT